MHASDTCALFSYTGSCVAYEISVPAHNTSFLCINVLDEVTLQRTRRFFKLVLLVQNYTDVDMGLNKRPFG